MKRALDRLVELSSRVRSRRDPARRAAFTSLESRMLLSGAVSATVHNGLLTVAGDASDNVIAITQTGLRGDQLRISGTSGTKINSESTVVVSGVSRGVLVEMNGGADSVKVGDAAIAGDVTVRDFRSINALTFDDVQIDGDLAIANGANRSSVKLTETTVDDDLTILGGRHGQKVALQAVTVDGRTKVAINGEGESTITFDDSTFRGDVAIDTGIGADVVQIDARGAALGVPTAFAEQLSIYLNSGDDTLQVGVTGEAGNHATFLNRTVSHVTDGFVGNNPITGQAEYAARINFNGGPGRDTLKDFDAATYAGASRFHVTKFEAFRRSDSIDLTVPTVSSIAPANHVSGVALNKKIAILFSEGMDASTINGSTVKVTQRQTKTKQVAVAGTVSYVGHTATFTPAAALKLNTNFTVTVTTGAKDAEGMSLARSFVSYFRTGAARDTSAPTVSSVVPSGDATGVALNQQIVTTFSEAMDPATINAANVKLAVRVTKKTQAAVAGTVSYVGNVATFTPSAALRPNTKYTMTIGTGAKDLAGNALTGSFTWSFRTGDAPDVTAPTLTSVNPANEQTGVAVNRAIAATFSEAMAPTTLDAATVLVTGPGGTPVAGSFSYAGNTMTFTPTVALAASTTYSTTITVGATDLAGNALAAPFAWTFTTGVAPDVIAPTVTLRSPAALATNVPINASAAATFSEAMSASTLTNTTFTITGPSSSVVAGTVTYDAPSRTATFSPTSSFAASTTYTATITTGATDLAGNALAANSSWTFTTGVAPDVTAPTVTLRSPTASATNVPINASATATFSEAIDASTLSTATFRITGPNSSVVAGVVTYDAPSRTATFAPTADFLPSTTYTARVIGGVSGVTDLAGNAMASTSTWTFTTGVAPDVIAPTVTLRSPAALATNVVLNKTITATFSEDMDAATIVAGTFKITGPSASVVAGAVTYDALSRTASFTPTGLLDPSTLYTATIVGGINGAKDLAGNAIAADVTWTFTTGTQIAQPPIDLGDAGTFAVMATTSITSSGGTVVNGDVGLSPGTSQGIPPSQVIGDIHINDQAVLDAQDALLDAYNDAVSRAVAPGVLPGNMGGQTFTPGLYKNSTSVLISGVGAGNNVTLDAMGDPDAIFIFQMGSTLTTGANTQVILAGGARAENIFWQVGTSATLNTATQFHGNVLASVTITVNTGSAVVGRLFAGAGGGGGSVTIDSSTVTVPT